MIAQVDKEYAAVVANAMTPARQANGFANMALTERAAGMGPVTMHECLNRMSEGRSGGQMAGPKERAGFTRGEVGRQPKRTGWGSKKAVILPIFNV